LTRRYIGLAAAADLSFVVALAALTTAGSAGALAEETPPGAAAEEQAGGSAPPADEAEPKAPAPSLPVESVEVLETADRAASDPSAFATIIRPEDFADRITSLPELLRDTIGVQVKSLGGEFATVSIRGSSAEQVVVYLDGVPLNRALGAAVNLADLPLVQVDSIEIYRGFTPASLSSASIGGAILIHSKAAAGAPRGQAAVSLGSFGTAELSGGYAASGPRGDVYLGADAASSDGDFLYLDDNGTDFEPSDDEWVPRVNNDFRRTHLLANGRLNLGRPRLSLSVDLLERGQGVPGVGANPSTQSRYETSRLLATSQLEAPGLLDGRLLMRGTLAATLHDLEYEGAQGDVPDLVRHTDNRIASLAFDAGGTYVLSSHQGLSFLVGGRRERADLRNRVLDPSDIGQVTRDVVTVTLEDQVSLMAGRLLVNPSLRHERYRGSFDPGPSTGVVPQGAPDEDVTTGKIGFRLDAKEGVAVRGNFGTFLRLPDVVELFGDQGSVVGNPGLLPERGRNGDLGLAIRTTRPHGAVRQARTEVVVFESLITDLILYRPTGPGPVVADNIGEARIRGIELTFDLVLGPRFSGTLNVVHQTAIDVSDRFTEGNDLPGRPRDELSAGAVLAVGRGRAAYDFTYVGENYVNSVNTESGLLPARYLHDLSYRLPLASGFEATFQVRNVLDEQTVDVARFPLPGRSFEARLQWTH
jgi:iron complex outermembrane receptor protein